MSVGKLQHFLIVPVCLSLMMPVAARGDEAAKAAVAAAFAKMSQAKTYRMTMHAQSTQMVSDFVAPDRRHMTGSQMEMITIGDDAWMKMNGKWQHIPKTSGMSGAAMGNPAMGAAQRVKAPENDVTFLGNETCQGQPARAYQYSTGTGSEKAKLLIGSSGYPCRIDMAAGTSMEWSDWNTPMSITAPM
jgi:hypothetical protein